MTTASQAYLAGLLTGLAIIVSVAVGVAASTPAKNTLTVHKTMDRVNAAPDWFVGTDGWRLAWEEGP